MKTVSKQQLIDEIIFLLSDISASVLSPSPYDTAWVSMIPDAIGTHPLFPQTLAWILANQNDDGSWGNTKIFSYQDHIVNTLMSAIALTTWQIGSEQITAATNYITNNLDKVSEDKVDGIAFELIFPTLIELAGALKLAIPYTSPVIAKYQQIKEFKLSKIPIEVVTQKKTTLGYSLEFLEAYKGTIDFDKININQEENGSYATSPASTAFVLKHHPDEKALQYITRVLEKFEGFVPVVYPIDNFEASWSLNYFIDLKLTDVLKDAIPTLLQHLQENWTTIGLAWSGEIKLPDLDDTCVAYRALRHFGINLDTASLLYYKKDGKFVGFEGEKEANPSYLANLIRALEWVDDMPDAQQNISDCLNLLNTLYSNHQIDKWHLSEYYLISRLIFKANNFREDELLNYLLSNQNSDGGWGKQGSTTEETCYALIYILNSKTKVDRNVKKRSFEYLLEHKSDAPVPLWISKCLYAPVRLNAIMVNSTLLSLMENGEV